MIEDVIHAISIRYFDGPFLIYDGLGKGARNPLRVQNAFKEWMKDRQYLERWWHDARGARVNRDGPKIVPVAFAAFISSFRQNLRIAPCLQVQEQYLNMALMDG